MKGFNVAATSPVPAVAERAFADIGEIVLVEGGDNRRLNGAEVLIVRGQKVDAALLEECPSLRVIARTGAGLDAIDLGAATRRGIPVVYAPGVGVHPMAEGTLALILAVAKRVGELGRLIKSDRWKDRYDVAPADVRGATLGIVGLGRVGAEVARLARCLGMQVVAAEQRPGPRYIPGDPDPVPNLPLDELVGAADVITLHCDLNAATRGMVDVELLSHAGPGAILINAARGEIVRDHDTIREALDRGWLAGVGLDVFIEEPPDPDDPLFADPRVVSTPHTIGLTADWNRAVFSSLAADVRAVLEGLPPRHLANPDVSIGVAAP